MSVPAGISPRSMARVSMIWFWARSGSITCARHAAASSGSSWAAATSPASTRPDRVWVTALTQARSAASRSPCRFPVSGNGCSGVNSAMKASSASAPRECQRR